MPPTETVRRSRPIVGWRSLVPVSQLVPAVCPVTALSEAIRGASRKVFGNHFFFFLNNFVSTSCDAAAAFLACSTSTSVYASLSVGWSCVRSCVRACPLSLPSLSPISVPIDRSRTLAVRRHRAAAVTVTVVVSSDSRV